MHIIILLNAFLQLANFKLHMQVIPQEKQEKSLTKGYLRDYGCSKLKNNGSFCVCFRV